MWAELGIDPTGDERAIKRAYARRLKLVHPEDDPEGFQRLRAAYEAALRHAPYYAQQVDDFDREYGQEESAQVESAQDAGAEVPGPGWTVEHEPSAQSMPPVPTPHPWSELHAEADDASSAGDADDKYEAAHAAALHAETEATQHLHARARALVQPIVEAIEQQQNDLALTRLRAAFDELIELDLAEAFEQELAHAWERLDWVPGVVLRAAAEHFGWHGAERGLAQLQPWNSRLREQVHTLEVLRHITAASTGHGTQALAKRLLLGPHDQFSFYRHALSASLLNEMRSLLAGLTQDAPLLLERYVDARTLAWWRNAVNGPRLHGWHVFGSFVVAVLLFTRVPQWLPGSMLERVPLLAWFALGCLACYGFQRPLSRWYERNPMLQRLTPNIAAHYRRWRLPLGLAAMALTWLAYHFPFWIKLLLAAAFVAVLLPIVVSMFAQGARFGLAVLTGALTAVLASLMPGDEGAHVWLLALCALWVVILAIDAEVFTADAPSWVRKPFEAERFRRYYGWGVVAMAVLLSLSGVLSGAALDVVGAAMFVIAVLYLCHCKAALGSMHGYGFMLLGVGVGVLSAAMAAWFPDAIRHVLLFALCLLLAVYTFVAALRKS